MFVACCFMFVCWKQVLFTNKNIFTNHLDQELVEERDGCSEGSCVAVQLRTERIMLIKMLVHLLQQI